MREMMNDCVKTVADFNKAQQLPSPDLIQAMTMLNAMSEKALRQACAHIAIIHRFDKGAA